MVQLNLVSMMWSMREMTKIFESPPTWSHYGDHGFNTTIIRNFYENATLGGPSFTTWKENEMALPTAKWIET